MDEPNQRYYGGLHRFYTKQINFLSKVRDFLTLLLGYSLFRLSYNILMTIASFELAKNIPGSSYGLVFGFNMFVGVGLESGLAFGVSSSSGFALDVQDQFAVYAAWYFIAGLAFSLVSYAGPVLRWIRPGPVRK